MTKLENKQALLDLIEKTWCEITDSTKSPLTWALKTKDLDFITHRINIISHEFGVVFMMNADYFKICKDAISVVEDSEEFDNRSIAFIIKPLLFDKLVSNLEELVAIRKTKTELFNNYKIATNRYGSAIRRIISVRETLQRIKDLEGTQVAAPNLDFLQQQSVKETEALPQLEAEYLKARSEFYVFCGTHILSVSDAERPLSEDLFTITNGVSGSAETEFMRQFKLLTN